MQLKPLYLVARAAQDIFLWSCPGFSRIIKDCTVTHRSLFITFFYQNKTMFWGTKQYWRCSYSQSNVTQLLQAVFSFLAMIGIPNLQLLQSKICSVLCEKQTEGRLLFKRCSDKVHSTLCDHKACPRWGNARQVHSRRLCPLKIHVCFQQQQYRLMYNLAQFLAAVTCSLQWNYCIKVG